MNIKQKSLLGCTYNLALACNNGSGNNFAQVTACFSCKGDVLFKFSKYIPCTQKANWYAKTLVKY